MSTPVTSPYLKRLTKFVDLYHKASQRGDDTFVFESHVVLTRYAHYLIASLRQSQSREESSNAQ